VPDCTFNLDAVQKRTFVADIVYRQTVDSTNDLALTIATSSHQPGGSPVLVLANEQLSGRGRQGRRWESSQGSLTFSLLFSLEAAPGPTRVASLSLATAVGVHTALTELLTQDNNHSVIVKWPNDVLVDGRKICGILVETTSVSPGSSHAVVVGVGINVNNRIVDTLRTRATSLADRLGQPVDIEACLVKVLQHVATSIDGWQEPLPELVDRWNRASEGIGQQIAVETPTGIVAGTSQGIDDSGRLLVEQPDGSVIRVASGTVR
jgi:BirA family biotin operon repressor/biotin-[acetyl-CoA-carboxylase] ligase